MTALGSSRGTNVDIWSPGRTGNSKGLRRQNVIRVSGHLLVDAEPIARGRNVADWCGVPGSEDDDDDDSLKVIRGAVAVTCSAGDGGWRGGAGPIRALWVIERNGRGLSLHRESIDLPVRDVPGANQLPSVVARRDGLRLETRKTSRFVMWPAATSWKEGGRLRAISYAISIHTHAACVAARLYHCCCCCFRQQT